MSDRELRILIVDDEDIVLQTISMATEMGGWECRKASSAEAALAMIEEEMPDVILSDKNMPEMSGVELLRHVREKSHDVSFHLLTGFASQRSVKEAMDLDVDGYVQKPFRNVFAMLQDIRAAHFRRVERNKLVRDRGETDGDERGQEGPASQALTASVLVADPILRNQVVRNIHDMFDDRVAVTAAGKLSEVAPNTHVVLSDFPHLEEVRKAHPLACVGVLAGEIPALAELVSLADRGVSTIAHQVPDAELHAQLAGLLGRALPALGPEQPDQPTSKIEALPQR